MIFHQLHLLCVKLTIQKKLDRISGKMLSGFLTTLIFPLIVAVIYRFITYNLDLFNVSLSGMSGANLIASSGNPLYGNT